MTSKSNEPLVSICLLSYNDEQYIGQAIQDLLGQDYVNIELIISDDCSKDNSPQIIKDFAKKDERIRFFIQECQLGMQGNYNFLLSKARGDYFMWASSDDRWASNCVSSLANILMGNSELISVGMPYQFIDESGDLLNNVMKSTKLRDFEGSHSLMRLAKFAFYYIDDFFYGLHRKSMVTGLVVPVWWGINAQIPANCPYPVQAFLLARGGYARLSGEGLLYKRMHPSSPPRHSNLYRGRPFINLWAILLRKANVLYETIRAIYRGSGSVGSTLICSLFFVARFFIDIAKVFITTILSGVRKVYKWLQN